MGSRRLSFALLCLWAVFLTGCPKDPYDPDTWIDQLDDPSKVERAITELERLKDPKAIVPLSKTWKKHNKWSRALRAIITLADQPTAKNGPFWKDAIPILEETVKDYDASDRRSVDDAVVACEALGRSKNADSVTVLIDAANGPTAKALPKLSLGQNVRIAALRALGAFGQNDRAMETLVSVLQVADPKLQVIQLNAAAANGLAESENPKAVQPLIRALFEISPIYQQVRSALTRIGKPVVPEMIKVLQGQHAEMNKFAEAQHFATDCDKGEGPDTTCIAPGNLAFKAAAILGDLRAKEAVPALLDVLGKPAKTAFFDPGSGAAGPSNHSAVLDALRVIGDGKAADQVLAYVKDDKTSDEDRPIAIDVYSMLATDDKGMDTLSALMNNPDEDAEEIRRSAAMAYARLVHDKSQLGAITHLEDLQLAKAAEYDGKAAKASKQDEKDQLTESAQGFRDIAALFEQHKTRAMVGVKCGSDPKCYIGYLDKSADDVIKELGVKIDPKAKKAEKEAFRTAALERALIEVAKLGPKAAGSLPALLKNADATDRIVRQGVLMAMVQTAKMPCNECAQRLADVVDEQKSQSTLDFLTADTRIVLNFFVAQGAKVTGGDEGGDAPPPAAGGN